ncbi:MAG TPA: gephyrin-like molybdotransferase Glp [Gemmatimonadota bacterium]|nr:gephyrin-like molybdotransferase Glp [Gemmatimonadota bacterium]
MVQQAALPVAEAQRRILARLPRLPGERIAVRDATGRVAAEPVISRLDLPPWDNSAMDGYAVRSADVHAGEPLPVALDLPAGSTAGQVLPARAAARIMTGAPLPENADAIVPVETSAGPRGAGAYADPGEWVAFEHAPVPGHHVRVRGEDVRRGDTVVAEGEPFTPARIALAASVGAAEVVVFRRPSVTIVSTGDELVGVERAGEPDRIVDANTYGLATMVERAGGVVAATLTVSDDEVAVGNALRTALGSDAVVTVGGVSMGARDPVRPALARAGVELDFWRVAIRPGGPTAFGVGPGGRPVFALPGNPVSALVTFELFVRPALLRMAGHRACFRRPIRARLAEAVDPTPGKATYLRCRLEADGAGWRAVPAGAQGSAVLSTLARAHGLALVPDSGRLEPGAPVEVWPLSDEPFHREDP